MTIGSSSDPPRPDTPALPPTDLLLLDLLPGERLCDLALPLLLTPGVPPAARSCAINRIVTLLLPAGEVPSSVPALAAADAAVAVTEPLRLLREGLLLVPPLLAKRLANADDRALPTADPARVLPPGPVADEPVGKPNGLFESDARSGRVVPPLPVPEEFLLELLRGAILVGLPVLLPAVPAAAATPLAEPATKVEPPALLPGLDSSPSGKNISITPTIPPPCGRIMRICGLPSSLIPKVTCAAPRSGPLSELTLARICSIKAALTGKPVAVCWFRSSTVREFTRRLLDRGEGPRLARVLEPPLPDPPAVLRFLFALLSWGVAGNATARSIVLNRLLQQGHLFSISLHLAMQSKQN